MMCSIMQPTYIPWIGYFDLIDKVDIFIFYDDVQLVKRSWQARNKLKGSNGEIWLTVPIKKTKHRDSLLIKQAEINNEEDWKNKHIKTIEHNYKKAKYFKDVFPFLLECYKDCNNLSTFNINIITNISKKIGINTPLINASSIENVRGKKDYRLVVICQKIEADSYLSPIGSAQYINEENLGGQFAKIGIDLYYHDYAHPQYCQLYNNFIPYIGIFDLLMNVGFNNSLEIIRSGRKENIPFQFLETK